MKLTELKALIAKATPGPFEFANAHDCPIVLGAGIVDRSIIARHANDNEGVADAKLHARLRTLAPTLIAIAEAAQDAIDAKMSRASIGKLCKVMGRLK